jgi:hypothetical protein
VKAFMAEGRPAPAPHPVQMYDGNTPLGGNFRL